MSRKIELEFFTPAEKLPELYDRTGTVDSPYQSSDYILLKLMDESFSIGCLIVRNDKSYFITEYDPVDIGGILEWAYLNKKFINRTISVVMIDGQKRDVTLSFYKTAEQLPDIDKSGEADLLLRIGDNEEGYYYTKGRYNKDGFIDSEGSDINKDCIAEWAYLPKE